MLPTTCGESATSILQTRDSIQRALKQILRSRQTEAGEDYVTLRNDRFVIPVRSEQRRARAGGDPRQQCHRANRVRRAV